MPPSPPPLASFCRWRKLMLLFDFAGSRASLLPGLDPLVAAGTKKEVKARAAELMLLSRSFSAWIHHLLACMGGCFGCCTKPTPIIAVDEPSKGLKIQGRTVKKHSISEDFWSASTFEMENSGVQSQRSISSISTAAQAIDNHGAGSSSNPPEFINHGVLLWNQTRQQWIGNRRPDSGLQQVQEPTLCWNATYESLLVTNKPFPQPIPLSEMVDFLVDVWEQEGMYD